MSLFLLLAVGSGPRVGCSLLVRPKEGERSLGLVGWPSAVARRGLSVGVLSPTDCG